MAIMLVQAIGVISVVPSAYPTSNIAGNLLICLSRGPSTQVVNDNNGNTWVQAVARNNGSNGISIWYAANCKAGNGALNLAGPTVVSTGAYILAEYSGIALVNPLDKTNSAVSAGNPYAAGSVIPSQAAELIIGAISNEVDNSVTDTPTGGFTDVTNAHGNVFLANQIIASLGTYSYGGSISQNVPVAAAVASFKAPVSSGGPGTGMPPFGWVNTQGDHYNKRGLR